LGERIDASRLRSGEAADISAHDLVLHLLVADGAIVGDALDRIGEGSVRPVEVLAEFLRGRTLVGPDAIGMKPLHRLAVRLGNLGGTGGVRHREQLIIVVGVRSAGGSLPIGGF